MKRTRFVSFGRLSKDARRTQASFLLFLPFLFYSTAISGERRESPEDLGHRLAAGELLKLDLKRTPLFLIVTHHKVLERRSSLCLTCLSSKCRVSQLRVDYLQGGVLTWNGTLLFSHSAHSSSSLIIVKSHTN